MRKIIIGFILVLISNISSAQSGWGYVNYTSYKLFNGTGIQNQYAAFPYSAAEFDNMLNTANSNTTIYKTGEVPISYVFNGSVQTPHWNGDYYAIKFDFWFIPQETGTYYFGINSDDASDLSIDGTIIATYYGGHGAGGFQTGSKSMIAGQRYKVIVRYQEYGGGDALYFRWYKPSGTGGWGYWNNEVTNINSAPTKQAKMNFDFGGTLDKTKLSVNGTSLNSSGLVDVTNSLDSNKVANGNKGIITGGGVEWSYVNPNASWLGGNSRLLIDMRKFGNTSPSSVKSVKILDCYDGPVTYLSQDAAWAQYSVPSPLTKVTDGTSTLNQYIRNVNGWNTDYAFACDVSFGSVMEYKPQSVTMTTSNTLSTMYNSIVTVSDVYLAFKELSNGGLFGNQTGNEFTYGIQYKNADVNDDGVFNEADTYRLLQYLTGVKNIVDTFTLPNVLKLIPTTTYNTIGKSNWNASSLYLGDVINFNINTDKPIDTFNISGTWKGDVNLSHSATPLSNGITTMSVKTMNLSISNEINASIIGELIGGKLIVTISLDPLQQQVVGTQFQLNYDNVSLKFEKVEFTTKGFPMNYGVDKGTYINLGSLVTDGITTLDKTTEYKITFLPLIGTFDSLGLTSISSTDAVNKNGTQLKVKLN